MFQLVFKGECTPGTDQASARDNARALFKASVDQIERMFSGRPVVIRNKLDEAQAEKYRAVLGKHGLVAYVQLMPDSSPGAKSRPDPKSAKTGSVASSGNASAGTGVKTEPGERLQVAGDRVDDILSGSALELDPAGVTLAEAAEKAPPMFQHLEDWTLAPAGSDIGVKRDLPPPVVPDVSHLSLDNEETEK